MPSENLFRITLDGQRWMGTGDDWTTGWWLKTREVIGASLMGLSDRQSRILCADAACCLSIGCGISIHDNGEACYFPKHRDVWHGEGGAWTMGVLNAGMWTVKISHNLRGSP